MQMQYGNVGKGTAALKVLLIGHSKGRGNSSAAGDNPVGVLSEWNNSTSKIVQVGASDVIDAVGGSYWPIFAIEYYRATGRRVQLCNNGIGGSAYRYDLDANLSWYNTGNLWSASVTKARNWLNYVGAVDPDLVVLHLGINDANKAPVTTTYADITDLIDRINTEYNTPRIMVVQEATNPSVFMTTWQLQFNINQFRIWQKQLSFDYANVEVAMNEAYLNTWLTAALAYQGDGVHLTYDGNAFLGARLARQAALSDVYHKAGRNWIGCDYFNPTGQRKQWLNQLAADLDAAGILVQLDSLHITSNEGSADTTNRYKNSTKDLAYVSSGAPTAAAMTLYDGMLGNGTTESWSAGVISMFSNKSNVESDFISGVFLVDNLDAAGTLGTLIGTRESATGSIVYLGQNAASQLDWCAGDGALDTDATETAFADGNHYAVARSAAGGTNNKHLIKNATVVRTVTRASAALAPGAGIRGSRGLAYNNNGTVQNFMNAKVSCIYTAKYNGFDLTSFVSIMNSFLSNWLQNL